MMAPSSPLRSLSFLLPHSAGSTLDGVEQLDVPSSRSGGQWHFVYDLYRVYV